MQLFALLLGKKNEKKEKTLADYQREALVEQGKEQFQLLIERGLGISVAFSK